MPVYLTFNEKLPRGQLHPNCLNAARFVLNGVFSSQEYEYLGLNAYQRTTHSKCPERLVSTKIIAGYNTFRHNGFSSLQGLLKAEQVVDGGGRGEIFGNGQCAYMHTHLMTIGI